MNAQLSMNAEPARPADALAFYMHGLELARNVGDIHEEGKNALGVVWATTVLRTVEAAAIGHEALLRLVDNRHWSLIWIATEIVASHLFFESNIEAAALIYGHLEAHHPAWGGEHGRVRALQRLRKQPGAEQWLARGASMTDDEVVALVLDRLVQHAPVG